MPIYKMQGSKNGKQKYRVRINYTDNFGINRQLTRIAYGSSEAKELERELEFEVKQSKPVARMTVQNLYEEYVNALKCDIRETSLKKSMTILENHILPILGDTSLDKLTPPTLQHWKQEIEKKGLKTSTKKNIYSIFRALLNWGIKLDYLQTNNLTKIGNFKDVEFKKAEFNFYTGDEYKLFSKAARTYAETNDAISNWDYFVFFSIAFYTGLRKGEIHALKWSDIDNNFLNVQRSICQKLHGEDRETPPKNKSSIRTLQMPLPLINILNEHKQRYMKNKNFSEEYRICGGERCLRDTTIEVMNKKFSELSGLKKIRIHDFRHSHVSLLANAGVNIQEIARRLGHSDIKMTWNTYSHLYPREEERAVEILNKII